MHVGVASCNPITGQGMKSNDKATIIQAINFGMPSNFHDMATPSIGLTAMNTLEAKALLRYLLQQCQNLLSCYAS